MVFQLESSNVLLDLGLACKKRFFTSTKTCKMAH